MLFAPCATHGVILSIDWKSRLVEVLIKGKYLITAERAKEIELLSASVARNVRGDRLKRYKILDMQIRYQFHLVR